MASRRYSRILQSARYYNALDNYIQYVTNTEARNRNRRVGQGEARPPSVPLFIQPFGVALPAAVRVPVSAAQPEKPAPRCLIPAESNASCH